MELALPFISVSGTYFLVGETIGKRMKDAIHKYMTEYKYLGKLQTYVQTTEGRSLYRRYIQTVSSVYPQCIKELEGVAKGANVPFEDLFLLNIEPELSCILGDTAKVELQETLYDKDQDSSESTPGTTGCTNIFIKDTEANAVLYGHTEDFPVMFRDASVWVDVTVVDHLNDKPCRERFSFFAIAGILPGGMFGVISPTKNIIISCNNIFQKSVNADGIPRRILNRMCLKATSIEEYISIARSKPGIASGYHVQLISRGIDVTCISLELASSDDGGVLHSRHIDETDIHVNLFKYISTPCHQEESSLQRLKTFSQLTESKKTNTKTELLCILSNTGNNDFPMYRNGLPPDYLATIGTSKLYFRSTATVINVKEKEKKRAKPATVIYGRVTEKKNGKKRAKPVIVDLNSMELEAYTGKSSETEPTLTFDILKMLL